MNQNNENQVNECRICYGDASQEPFVNACNCMGSLKYVHKSCIEIWRRSNPNRQEKCSVCKTNYKGKEINLSTLSYFQYAKKLSLCFAFTCMDFLSFYMPFLLMVFCFEKYYNQDVTFEIYEDFSTYKNYLINGHYNFCCFLGIIVNVCLTLATIYFNINQHAHPSRYALELIDTPNFDEDKSAFFLVGFVVIYYSFAVYFKKQWTKYSYLTYKKLTEREYDLLEM